MYLDAADVSVLVSQKMHRTLMAIVVKLYNHSMCFDDS